MTPVVGTTWHQPQGSLHLFDGSGEATVGDDGMESADPADLVFNSADNRLSRHRAAFP
ncbi:MAG: hypothetical protein OEM40_08850 [Acidimicrobiia bacterium]|nr:hypothetical protein [Acidimicrobiia bacterium]